MKKATSYTRPIGLHEHVCEVGLEITDELSIESIAILIAVKDVSKPYLRRRSKNIKFHPITFN